MRIVLKPGARLFSAVCVTEMIVVKAPLGELELTIGGAEPVLSASDRPESGVLADGHSAGTSIGKRYVNDDGTIELLCTKAGEGTPALGGEPLVLKEAKPLPASD